MYIKTHFSNCHKNLGTNLYTHSFIQTLLAKEKHTLLAFFLVSNLFCGLGDLEFLLTRMANEKQLKCEGKGKASEELIS